LMLRKFSHSSAGAFGRRVGVKSAVFLAVAALAQPAFAEDENAGTTGILCDARFRAEESGYYEQAGTDFSYAIWIPGVPASDIPTYEAFLVEHYRSSIDFASRSPGSYALGYTSFQGVECAPLRLSGELKWATSWGKTSRQADGAISDYFGRRRWYLDDTVNFDDLKKAKPEKPVLKEEQRASAKEESSEVSAAPPKKSAAQIAAEEAAARRAQREAEFQAKQDEYQRQLADRERRVQEFNELQAKMEAQKEANRLAAEKALAEYQAKMAEHSQTVAQHDAEQARYEQQFGAAGSASTDEDANRCVTAAEVTQNASFKGNTAASVTNGCGKPVDLRICLMTGKGWNCGVQWGLAPQDKWSFSSFNATGEVFVDARTSGSNRPLASPQ